MSDNNFIYNTSYTDEENKLVDNYFKTATEEELAYAIDSLCRNVYAAQDDNFLFFYEKQINRLHAREEYRAKNHNIKKETLYNEKLLKFEKLRPLLMEEYKTRNGGTTHGTKDFNRDSFYDNHVKNVFKPYITRKEMKQIMAKPGSKTSYKPKKPIPEKEIFSNIEVIKTLGRYLLQYLLQVIIYYLGSEDISHVYITLLFVVSSQVSDSPVHHTKEKCPISFNRDDVTNLLKQYEKLLDELNRSKKELNDFQKSES